MRLGSKRSALDLASIAADLVTLRAISEPRSRKCWSEPCVPAYNFHYVKLGRESAGHSLDAPSEGEAGLHHLKREAVRQERACRDRRSQRARSGQQASSVAFSQVTGSEDHDPQVSMAPGRSLVGVSLCVAGKSRGSYTGLGVEVGESPPVRLG